MLCCCCTSRLTFFCWGFSDLSQGLGLDSARPAAGDNSFAPLIDTLDESDLTPGEITVAEGAITGMLSNMISNMIRSIFIAAMMSQISHPERSQRLKVRTLL
jgi:hypothetical protein